MSVQNVIFCSKCVGECVWGVQCVGSTINKYTVEQQVHAELPVCTYHVNVMHAHTFGMHTLAACHPNWEGREACVYLTYMG